MSPKSCPRPPIAVVGMGLRLPGNITNPEEFWEFLINKRNGQCRVPADRFNIDGFHDAQSHMLQIHSDKGYFLQDVNIKAFDAPFFSMTKAEVEILDPQQRLLLEVIWECMESAGQTAWRGTNIGCYVGVFGEDWHDLTSMDPQIRSNFRITGGSDFAISNRMSYEFNLKGPSMTIRTACSSTLTAVHEACQALYSGECEGAIVAGTNMILGPSMTLGIAEQGVLSRTGSCKTFDASADGYARGEAINAVFLKRLDDAVREGDPVRAVIRGTAVNCDGKTPGLSCPSAESHEALMRRAYEVAGISDVTLTPFVECHGTGTQIGDPLEATAVGNVFGKGRRGTYIGSVKPNVGHAEGASGITSLIKAVLALENQIIPPNINYATPNPKIPFERAALEVPLEPTPWPKGRPARISVNSFGIGGANAHVILESASSFSVPSNSHDHLQAQTNGEASEQTNGRTNGSAHDYTNGKGTVQLNGHAQSSSTSVPAAETNNMLPRLLLLSANSAHSLRRRVQSLVEYLQHKPGSLDQAAHTLSTRRDHLAHRSFAVVAPDVDETPAFEPFTKTSPSALTLTFVFTGQGAQWVGMGRGLILHSAAFRDDIRALDRTLQELFIDDPPTWTLEEMLSRNDEAAKQLTRQAEFAQPLCTALQVAVVDWLARAGVRPAAVVGHSSGELAAAYAAGALTAAEAITGAYLRGKVTKLRSGGKQGAMAAVGLGRDAVAPFLGDEVCVACENSPSSSTLSGDVEAVERTIAAIQAKDIAIFTRRLEVDMAYHSHHMLDIGGAYEDQLGKYKVIGGTAKVPFYSTVTGVKAPVKTSFGPAYWRSNLESPVLFSTATQALLRDTKEESSIGGSIFLEIGPHSALSGPLRQIFQEHQRTVDAPSAPIYVPTLVRGDDSAATLVSAVGKLWAHGCPAPGLTTSSAINPPAAPLTDLPTYPWDHSAEYWSESRLTKAWRNKKHPHHELLGSACLEANDSEPMWRNLLRVYDVPWLRDHKIVQDIVFPCAGYIAMMGEALRQTTGSEAYTLRDLVVKSALVLQETDDVEFITSLRPARLTDSTNQSWFDISISAFNGATWVEHCVAQGKAAPRSPSIATLPSDLDIPGDSYPRHISSKFWYERLERLGLNYGPYFQGMSSITSDVHEYAAQATLRAGPDAEGALSPSPPSRYAAHPTMLDQCMQIFTVAMVRGIARGLTTLAVPSTMGSITVIPSMSAGPVRAHAKAAVSVKGGVRGSMLAVSDGLEVVRMQEGTFAPLDSGGEPLDDVDMDALSAARAVWRPDMDLASDEVLVREMRPVDGKRASKLMIEKFCALCVLRSLDELALLPTSVVEGAAGGERLSKFAAWLHGEKGRMLAGEWAVFVPEAQAWAGLEEASDRTPLYDAVGAEVEDLTDYEAARIGTLCRIVAENIGRLFRGEVKAVELFVEDGRLTSFYNFYRGMMDFDDLFSLCAHARPGLRVLEIGAGTGGTTGDILKALVSSQGTRAYAKYTYTDISSGFFANAKERFSDYPGIEYKVLDISKSPVEQGFELGSYDLIVAANVIHATPSLHETLKNVRSLLRPYGRFFLQELALSMRWTNLIMGSLPGWWLGEGDNRALEPTVSAERWAQELRDAGFSGADAAVPDDDYPYQMNVNIVATAVETRLPQRATFLYHQEKSVYGVDLAEDFQKHGVIVSWSEMSEYCPNDNVPASETIVVSTVDLSDNGPLLRDIQDTEYSALMSFISKIRKGGVLWITRAAQINCTDPNNGLMVGFARTIRSELSVDFVTLELDDLDVRSMSAALKVFRKFHTQRLSATQTTAYNVEPEYAVRSGVVHIPRYDWISSAKELESPLPSDAPKRLTIGRYGFIDSLTWVQHELAPSLRDDEIEMDIHYVGVNFRDILVTMGIVKGSGDMVGLEASGIVRRVGAGIDHLRPGDRVIAVDNQTPTTRAIILSELVVRIPDSLSLEDAATMPIVYATVVHALVNLCPFRKGESVLIHSATGGVGLAALDVCRMLGADIYATVGSPQKVQYLMEKYGLPRNRIFHSRDDSFVSGIMSATGGRGVDVVLNSLSGELLHGSWRCVAPYGHMLEIGKRDFIGRGRLALDPFEANRTFQGVDIATMQRDRPGMVRGLMEQFLRYYEEGHIRPVAPVISYPANRIAEAFRFMQKGQHIGKIVIKLAEDQQGQASAITAVKAPRRLALSGVERTYLLAGGLGGLGKALVTWLVEHGARSVVFLSRSAGKSKEDRDFFRELEAQGCRAVAVAGSVADLADVRRAVAAAPTPISGVIQLSMVLRDLPLLQIQHQDWHAVLGPKVTGTWNLHEALVGVDLDFFILFSSLSSIWGQPGQANYAAANTFLASFVQYRHSLGLPCSVIDVGLMEGVGYVSQNMGVGSQFRAIGMYPVQEQQLMEAVHISIDRSHALPPQKQQDRFESMGQVTMGLRSSRPLSEATNRSVWKQDIRMALYRQLERTHVALAARGSGSGSKDSSALRDLVLASTADPEILHGQDSLAVVTAEIGRTLCGFMLRPEDEVIAPSTRLSDLGVDSLVSIEIRNWWRRTFGADITVLEIINASTVDRLGRMAIAALLERHGVKQEVHPKDMSANRARETYLSMKAP